MTNLVKISKTTASVPGGGTSYAPNPQTLAPDPAAPHVTWYLDETGATPGPGYGTNYYSMYVFIGPTPPASPFVGQLWWDSTNIGLFIWYDDGNSQQWVSAVAGVGSGADSALVPGTVTAVNTVGPGITGGPITTTGNLVVQWNAGQVFMLGSGLTLTAGTLNSVVGPDALSDGHAYGRLNAAWAQVLPLAGGTMTGAVVMNTGASNPARITYTSSHSYWVGAWMDGSFYISDNTTTTNRFILTSAGAMTFNGTSMGFNNAAPIGKPTISGACAGNTAIKALLTALANYGLIVDSTTV